MLVCRQKHFILLVAFLFERVECIVIGGTANKTFLEIL